MGFGALRVLNDDIVEPGYGFDMHPHSNFEIVTLVLEGSLEHRDSMGNHGIIKAGEIQRISAGSGIEHSEHNPSKKEVAKLLQIWVAPKERGITPSYEQKKFSAAKMKNRLTEVVSGKKTKGKIYIRQNAKFLLSGLAKGKTVSHKLPLDMGAFVFIIEGSARIGELQLGRRDCAEISKEGKFQITALEKAHILVIEVPLD